MKRMVIGDWMPRLLLATALVAMSAGASVAQSNSLGIPDSEYQALVALYNITNGPGWTNNSGWLTSSGEWYGVTVINGHVVNLTLGSNQLSGTIPPELGNLTDLSYYLDLSNNRLTGTIPSQLGSLTNLQWLVLNSNQLSGTIPSELGNLSSLTWPGLDTNQLSGTIPTGLGNLTNLTDCGSTATN